VVDPRVATRYLTDTKRTEHQSDTPAEQTNSHVISSAIWLPERPKKVRHVTEAKAAVSTFLLQSFGFPAISVRH
jgi:hypothetical protein